ncbi:hypothetical protein LTR06_011236 [Exophiala xenobiotica]|nr:hypothetical protein LTR06_011236 [Exophiala xenobiotica]
MPNMLGHSPLSAQFATNPLHLKTALFHTEVAAPIALRMTEMTCQYNASEKHYETAHNIALGTDLPFFPYLSQNPSIAARLQAGVKFLGGAEGTHTEHLVEMFDWAAFGEAKVVDQSHFRSALARDRKRIQFVSHDFFQPQPPASSLASIFLVRMVVQNHPKTATQTILRNIASVMKMGTDPVEQHHPCRSWDGGLRDEALDRAKSMFMMQAMNGADRGEEEFRELVEGCVVGLMVQEVVKCQRSALGLIIVQKK